MDPNALLAEFRQALRDWQKAASAEDQAAQHDALVQVAICATELDFWLSRGGYKPTAWKVVAIDRYRKER